MAAHTDVVALFFAQRVYDDHVRYVLSPCPVHRKLMVGEMPLEEEYVGLVTDASALERRQQLSRV